MIEKHYTVHAHAYNTRLNYYGDEIEGYWRDWSGEQERTFSTREAAEDFEAQERPGFGIGYNLETQEHETEYIFQVSQTFSTLGGDVDENYATEREAETAVMILRESLSQMIQSWEINETVKPSGDMREIAAWKQAQEIAGVLFDGEGNRIGGPIKWTRKSADYIAEQAVRIERVSL
jgi:hypothetical protein